MTTSQEIANLIAAHTNLKEYWEGKRDADLAFKAGLTTQVDTAETNLTAQYNTINNRVDVVEADRDILGNKAFHAATHKAIFQGWLHGSGFDANGVGWNPYGNGDFSHPEASVDAGQGVDVFLHLKTPLSLDEHNEMFLFNLYGQQYGGGKFIQETVAGYCYKNGNTLSNTQAEGNNSPAVYVGSDRFVYIRLSLLSSYYLTLGVDAIRVGNGRLFQKGDLIPFLSTQETL